MAYIINHFLAPKGYICNGTIEAQGEETNDHWWLEVKNNKVSSYGITYLKERVMIYDTPTEDLPLLMKDYENFYPENQLLYNQKLNKKETNHA